MGPSGQVFLHPNFLHWFSRSLLLLSLEVLFSGAVIESLDSPTEMEAIPFLPTMITQTSANC